MNSKSNKIKYNTNLSKNKLRTSVSPSYKFLSLNHKKEKINESSNHLNKSYEKFSSKHLNNISNSKLNITKKNISVQNYISKKKKTSPINNYANIYNHNHSYSITQNISYPIKNNINNSIIKTNFIPYKNGNHNLQKSLHLNTDLSVSRNSNMNYVITEDNTKKDKKENMKSDFLAKFMSKKQNKSLNKNNDFPNKINDGSDTEFIIENNEKNHFINNKTKKELANIFNDLESKLTIQLSENKNNNKIKNFNILQNTFDEIIKVFPVNNQHLLKIILKGYNDIVNFYISENKNLKEQNDNFKNKISSLEKELSINKNLLLEKNKIIDEIKKKTNNKSQEEKSNSTKGSSFNPSSQDKEIIGLNKKRNSFQLERQQHIKELNKKNIKDLDALYFYDKIIMNTEEKNGPLKDNNGDIIPLLDLDFDKRYKKEQDKIKKVFATKVHHNKSYSNTSFIKKAALSFNLK